MFITPFKEAGLESLNGENETGDDLEINTFVDDESENTIVDNGLNENDLPEDTAVIDDLDEEVEGTEALLGQIESLMNLKGAIEAYGISPGMMAAFDREGLLSSTFHNIPATESMAGPYRPDSQTSLAALEGIGDAIKSKAAEWSAKAGAFIKSVAARGGAMVTGCFSGASALAVRVAKMPWNAAKAGVAMVKAHPYKTIAVVIAAIAAVAGVFSLIWAFPQTSAAVAAWLSKIKNALTSIKLPTGAFKTAFTTQGKLDVAWKAANKGVLHVPDLMTPRPLNALGWTANAVKSAPKALAGALGSVKNAITKFPGAVRAAPGKAFAAVDRELNRMASRGPNAAAAVGIGVNMSIVAITMLAVKLTWLLIKHVVIGGYRFVKSMVSRVSSTASGGSTSEGDEDSEGSEYGAEG